MKKDLKKNLKTTFKIVGLIWFGLSLKILIDCYNEQDFSNAMDVVYFLGFAPFVAGATYVYTCLKASTLNKLICSLIFAFCGVMLLLAFYGVSHWLEGGDLNIRFIKVMSSAFFVVLIILYFQLPWTKEDDV